VPELEERYPKPTLSDLLTMRTRLERHSAGWLKLVQRVRELRYHEDELPEKWANELGLDDEHRFRTNLTDNEISRVVALMTRNRPVVYVPPAGERTRAKERAQKQTRWGQELIAALERDSVLPIWDRADDAAVETSLGVYEFFLTDDYEDYADAAEGMTQLKGADKAEAEAELRAMGLPFGLRTLDPTTVYWEPGYGKRSCSAILIVERKDYKQVFGELADKLTQEQWAEAQLPPIGALGMPASGAWSVSVSGADSPMVYDATPDDDGQVEVHRYYDDYWIVEYVAGRLVQAEPHGFPGIPVFLQFGKVTSSSYRGQMLRGVSFGMLEHETVLNDLLTLWEDNQFSYGRPFPVVETSEGGSALTEKDGTPQVIHLDDPHRPPQLGPGQKMADAFGQFRGTIDPQFVSLLNNYFHMSGLNPIAQGESPGADTSGFALNTQQSAATALYVQLLKNKQRTMGEIIDFARQVVKVCGFGVTVASGGENGSPIEYVTLGPDDVDSVPARVNIDPLSDAQRLAITQWAVTGNEKGFIQRSTVQRVAYGSVIDDVDAEDDGIIKDGAKRLLIPMLVQAVAQRVIGQAFPELAAPPAAPPGAPGAGPDPNAPPAPSTIGTDAAAASRVTPGGQSPAQGMAARSRGGQQPTNQPPPPNSMAGGAA